MSKIPNMNANANSFKHENDNFKTNININKDWRIKCMQSYPCINSAG
jgi:hypothetical protein